MVGKVKPGRRAGRPAEFDVGEVVDGAMHVFWMHGFDDTSVADLETELRVNRSTLYSSFNGKDGLYVAAVTKYADTMKQRLINPLVNGQRGLADLRVFFDSLCELLLDSETPAGCLIINAMGSGTPAPGTTAYLTNLRLGFDAALERATSLSEISHNALPERSSSLIASAIGINVAAKAGLPRAEVERLCTGVCAVIDGWSS